MKTILFPTDFSKDSFKALDFGLRYLVNESTEIIFINVYQIPPGAASGTFYLLEELKKQAEQDMVTFVKAIKDKYPELTQKITPKVVQGDFETQCNAVALSYGADCMLVGTKGASGIKEVLVGSNTVSLVKGLKVPLFVIPFNFMDNKMNSFIFTYDGTVPSQEAQKNLSKFAAWFNIPVNAVHVITEENPKIENWDQVRAQFEGLDFIADEIEGMELEAGLKEIIEKNEGLLCMIHHKQSFWDKLFNTSDSRKLVMHANMPVLVIPE